MKRIPESDAFWTVFPIFSMTFYSKNMDRFWNFQKQVVHKKPSPPPIKSAYTDDDIKTDMENEHLSFAKKSDPGHMTSQNTPAEIFCAQNKPGFNFANFLVAPKIRTKKNNSLKSSPYPTVLTMRIVFSVKNGAELTRNQPISL